MTDIALRAVDVDELVAQQAIIDRLLDAEGAGHVVHDLPLRSDGRVVALASRPWRLDPQPYLIDADTFAFLEGAVAQRMRACEAIIDDLYGDRRLIAERVVDPARLYATPRFRLAAIRAPRPRRWLTTFAVDLVRDVHGIWHAIQDLTDAPTGFGYALLDRSVITNVLLPDPTVRPRSIEGHLATLRRALASTSAAVGSRTVILTGGIDHPAYVEHSYLATRLGFNLVEGADLVVRRKHLWLRTLAGLEPVDVVHRRLEDHRLDPMEVNATGSVGVPGMVLAAQSGTVALANAHGTGVIEASELTPSWDDAAEFLTGYRSVIALRTPFGVRAGAGVDEVIGAPAERVPRLDGHSIVGEPIIIRMHAVASDDGITVLPCGNGRMLAAGDDPRVPTLCVAKDVWVLGPDDPIVVTGPPAPQVDLLTSVPTRAADSLSWLGRAAERAEAISRACRVALTGQASGANVPAERLLAALCRPAETVLHETRADDPAGVSFDEAGRRIADELGVMLAEAASVREFLSSTAGRVLGSMVEVRRRLQSGPPDVLVLDEALMELSAFSGLWNESVVRGPAWFYGDFARRHERAMVVLWSVAAFLPDPPRRMESVTMEALLAAHDSLVAYRRRYRSDLDQSAVLNLIVHDPLNPRSVRASLDRLSRAAEAIDWTDSQDEIEGIIVRLESAQRARDLVDVALALGDVSTRLVATRLVAPPDPTVIPIGSPLVEPRRA